MQTAACSDCSTTLPVSRLFAIQNALRCEPCADKLLRANPKLGRTPGAVIRILDPTICFRCKVDHDQTILATIAGRPVCDACATHVRCYRFPTWVKLSLAAIAVVVVFAGLHNRRFWIAYFDVRRAMSAVNAGRFEDAARFYRKSADEVPESNDLQATAAFYDGIMLLKERRVADAVKKLQRARHLQAKIPGIDDVIDNCEATLAFDAKDYDRFVDLARRIQSRNPRDVDATLGLASALACKHALSRDPAIRAQADSLIQKARNLPGCDDQQTIALIQRTQFRLKSGEIISPEQFEARFPNGWKDSDARP